MIEKLDGRYGQTSREREMEALGRLMDMNRESRDYPKFLVGIW